MKVVIIRTTNSPEQDEVMVLENEALTRLFCVRFILRNDKALDVTLDKGGGMELESERHRYQRRPSPFVRKHQIQLWSRKKKEINHGCRTETRLRLPKSGRTLPGRGSGRVLLRQITYSLNNVSDLWGRDQTITRMDVGLPPQSTSRQTRPLLL